MNLPSDQDYLDDLPQVLLNRANISSSRTLFTKSDSINSNYHPKLDGDNIVDSTLIQVTKSEVNELNSIVSCEGGLDVENPSLFDKECFKFATQCPEISSQKRERRPYGGSKIARRLREPPLNLAFPSKLLNYELKIIKQPEEQHRARYLTEGSRGTVKDKTGQGHPTVKLIGYDQPVTLQVYVGSDSGKIKPHGFYQACKVSHKNSSACVEKEIDGTTVIELPMDPKSEMTTVVDCVGILKLRNADVEQRIGLAKSKKKSTIARLVFRVNIPKSDLTYHTLQVSSTPILCTQPTGAPEISKKSLNQSSAHGGDEMFIIGKNFMKGTTVYFEEVRDHKVVWSREADIDQDFFQSTHLVCTVPPYLDSYITNPVEAQIVVNSSNRTSEPVPFTYLPCQISDGKSLGNSSLVLDESVNLSLSTGMVGEESLKRELVENGEPCFKRLAHDLVPNDSNVQAFIELVNDKSSPKNLSELGDQKHFPMMWRQDLNKSSALNNQPISSDSLNFPQDLHPYSPVPPNLNNSPESLILKDKTFLTLTPLTGSSNIMEIYPDNMTFIHSLSQNTPNHQSPTNQMFLISNSSNTADQSPRLTEMGPPDYMKLSEMNVDGEPNFRRDFLLTEKIMDGGMGCNLQETLYELKDLTSKVGVCSNGSQEEKPLTGFVDQNIVSQMINVDEKFIYSSPISDSAQPMSSAEQGVFESNTMGSFPTLSTSYEMVSDLRNFNDGLRAETQPSSECITGMSYDDKPLTINLMEQGVKSSERASFLMMETHSSTQNLPMNHHINPINETLYMSHGSTVDVGSVFRTSPESQQVFSDKSLDQPMAIQFEPGVHQTCIIADSGDNKTKSELYYLLTEEMPGTLLAPLAQQNQISPLPNLTVEEVSQVLNMSGS